MPRLLLLNGPPGIGKSTLARRWAGDHPPTLCCDVDVLRSMIGGWSDDFVGAGARVRPLALAVIGAHLREGHDVVLPQLLARDEELARFRQVADDTGSDWRHVVLLAEPAEVVRRFAARGDGEADPDPWHAQVRRIVAAQGGDDVLLGYRARLLDLLARHPDAVALPTDGLTPDETHARLGPLLSP